MGKRTKPEVDGRGRFFKPKTQTVREEMIVLRQPVQLGLDGKSSEPAEHEQHDKNVEPEADEPEQFL